MCFFHLPLPPPKEGAAKKFVPKSRRACSALAEDDTLLTVCFSLRLRDICTYPSPAGDGTSIIYLFFVSSLRGMER
jgi:hypothetical protein